MPKTRKTVGAAKRYPLNMRTTQVVREALEKAAADSGRSLAQEVEARLNQSLAAEMTWGSQEMQRVALLMASAFAMAGGAAARGAGHPEWTSRDWIRDKGCYKAGMISVIETIMLQFPDDASLRDIMEVFDLVKGRIFSRFAFEPTSTTGDTDEG